MWALLSNRAAEQSFPADEGLCISRCPWNLGYVSCTLVQEGSSSVFLGLGAELWIAGWCIPHKLTDQRLPTRGTEDKVRERNPEARLWGESLSLLSQRQAASGTSCCFFKWKLLSLATPPSKYLDLLRSIPDTEQTGLKTNRLNSESCPLLLIWPREVPSTLLSTKNMGHLEDSVNGRNT